MNLDYRNYVFTDGRTMQVGTMYCAGRNYADHASEMGAVVPSEPIIFIKPPSAYSPNGAVVELPKFSSEVHFEAELVVLIGSDCKDIATENAFQVVAGYGVGLDLTARDAQQRAKQCGEPWAVSKGFRHSAPISSIVPIEKYGDKEPHLTFSLFLNDEKRQYGDSKKMERSTAQIIAYLSSIFELRAGDCIFTGTPSGVGSVTSGDNARLLLHDYTELNVSFL